MVGVYLEEGGEVPLPPPEGEGVPAQLLDGRQIPALTPAPSMRVASSILFGFRSQIPHSFPPFVEQGPG